MAKSKHVKQQEAITRKRKQLDKIRFSWVMHQPNQMEYKAIEKEHGKERADQMAKEWDDKLNKISKEAGVDRHGNPEMQYDLTEILTKRLPEGKIPFNEHYNLSAEIVQEVYCYQCANPAQHFFIGAQCPLCHGTYKRLEDVFPFPHLVDYVNLMPLTPEQHRESEVLWGKLKETIDAMGGIRPVHLVAEAPLHPPIRIMDGMTNGIEPMSTRKFLSIVRGKHRKTELSGKSAANYIIQQLEDGAEKMFSETLPAVCSHCNEEWKNCRCDGGIGSPISDD